MQTFTNPSDVLDYALTLAQRGTAAEFGVATGGSLRRIVAGMPAGSEVYGFDSFDGLPETWRPGFPMGMFRTTVPDVPGATIVAGLFSETLAGHPLGRLALVHIDCDLYSSTATVLEGISESIVVGTLVVFDEFHSYPGCEEHEQRAWVEWTERYGVVWEPLAGGPEQLLVRITGKAGT